jgi:hypothetical protein
MNLTPDYSPDGQPARRQDQLAAIALTAREPDGRSERLTAGVASLHRHPTLGRYRPQDGTLGVLQPDAEDPLGEVTGLVRLLSDGIESPHKPLSR